jgi:hypothetical protein
MLIWHTDITTLGTIQIFITLDMIDVQYKSLPTAGYKKKNYH